MNPIAYFVFQKKTMFIPYRHLYPECLLMIKPHTKVSPLQCLRDSCPANRGCAEALAKRVNYLFNKVEPNAALMVAYFKYADSTSLRAGVFTREMDEPRLVTLNPYAFAKFQKEGVIRQWMPPFDFVNVVGDNSTPAIIPVESLVRQR